MSKFNSITIFDWGGTLDTLEDPLAYLRKYRENNPTDIIILNSGRNDQPTEIRSFFDSCHFRDSFRDVILACLEGSDHWAHLQEAFPPSTLQRVRIVEDFSPFGKPEVESVQRWVQHAGGPTTVPTEVIDPRRQPLPE